MYLLLLCNKTIKNVIEIVLIVYIMWRIVLVWCSAKIRLSMLCLQLHVLCFSILFARQKQIYLHLVLGKCSFTTLDMTTDSAARSPPSSFFPEDSLLINREGSAAPGTLPVLGVQCKCLDSPLWYDGVQRRPRGSLCYWGIRLRTKRAGGTFIGPDIIQYDGCHGTWICSASFMRPTRAQEHNSWRL